MYKYSQHNVFLYLGENIVNVLKGTIFYIKLLFKYLKKRNSVQNEYLSEALVKSVQSESDEAIFIHSCTVSSRTYY